MVIDVLIAEIGSTTTVVNALQNITGAQSNLSSIKPIFVGQGQAPTTVLDGDVRIGLNNAIEDLKNNLNIDTLQYNKMFATSSAAGGLRMTVHGLVYDMTVKAAKEAALGAGAILKFITAGKLRQSDLNKIKEIKPNLILVAGGVDYGERDTALYNFEAICNLELNVPIIYAGNIDNQDDIAFLSNKYNVKTYITENVYPKVDLLNVEPTRKIIQQAFEDHIIHAPGMTHVRDLVNGPIIPTPGAVMEAAKLLYSYIGDLIVFDVGGATTDLHSVTDGSEDIKLIQTNPEPTAKRTVEGDLGVFVNLIHIVEKIGKENLLKEFPDAEDLIKNAKPIPVTKREIEFIERLTLEAVLTALERHAGGLRNFYTPSGRRTVAEGKDLSNVKYIIGTGGALTRLPNRVKILSEIIKLNNTEKLYPKNVNNILIDNYYIMASLGVLAKEYPDKALSLLLESLNFNN
jgi:uncharacterized protein (TIGR01319 family)